jgi:uncharacterized protein YdeI (BOF family)
MRRTMIRLISIITVALLVGIGSTMAVAAGELQSMKGTISETGQFVSEAGETYELSGAKSDELRMQKDRKVEIRGTVTEKEGERYLDVKSYELEKK